jgi:hypothetical protein
VTWPQIVAGSLLVILLVAVSGFFLGRQVQVVRDLRRASLPGEEQRRLRHQTYRRLVTSSLLLLLGFLLATALLFLEGPAQQLADERDALAAAGQKADLSPAQKDFGRLYVGFWIGFLLILMTVLFLAAFDLWATRRHALLEHRKIQADRRAMLEQQINRLRHEDHG